MNKNQVRFNFDSEKGFGISCEIDGKEYTLLEGVTNANGFRDLIEEAYEQAHHVIDKAMKVADKHCIYCGAPMFEFNYSEDEMCIDCHNNSNYVIDIIENILKNKDLDTSDRVERYTNVGDDKGETIIRYTPDKIDLTIDKKAELYEQYYELVTKNVEETIKNMRKNIEAANQELEESIKVFKEVFKDE